MDDSDYFSYSNILLFTYALVIALNLSYPAIDILRWCMYECELLPVSQIYALTVPPVFNGTGLVANSTPIVGNLFFGNEPLMYLLNRWVFPTPVSPTRITKELINNQ